MLDLEVLVKFYFLKMYLFGKNTNSFYTNSIRVFKTWAPVTDSLKQNTQQSQSRKQAGILLNCASMSFQ